MRIAQGLEAPDPADMAACRALLAGGSKSFHAASRVLPARIAQPATALYAFCRVADDAIDLDSSPEALGRLQDRLAAIYAGCPQPEPADRAMAAVVARYGIPRAMPEALLEGFAWDREGRQYPTLRALHGYAARVAGTVGVMMALLMGERRPDVLARACDLGVAMQLTNIARDVGEDARAGRLYLPHDWLLAAGLQPAAFLANPVHDHRLAQVIARLLAEAERLYHRSEAGIGRLPLDCRPGINAARFIYAAIGHEVARRGHDSVSRRAVVSGRRKLALLARSLVAAVLPAGADASPPLAETRFLLAAVAADPFGRGDAGSDGPVIQLLGLFERLREQAQFERPDPA